MDYADQWEDLFALLGVEEYDDYLDSDPGDEDDFYEDDLEDDPVSLIRMYRVEGYLKPGYYDLFGQPFTHVVLARDEYEAQAAAKLKWPPQVQVTATYAVN